MHTDAERKYAAKAACVRRAGREKDKSVLLAFECQDLSKIRWDH